MQNPNEMWQAEVNGEIYDASFAELAGWINDNSLLETDKVRRGNLRWLEAGKVPGLRDFFNAKELGIEPPFVQVSTNTQTPFENRAEDVVQQVEPSVNISENQVVENTYDTLDSALNLPDANVCNIHPEIPATYICQACMHAFCQDCPQGFGSSVKICPYCGAMCKDVNEFQTEQQKELQFQADITGGFGFNDFINALAYPFKFKSSLFFGGLFLAFFGIGQKAASMGSIFLVAAALICFMFANAITFGVLANTIENFSQGFTTRNFMPSFDDFSMWDDVVHPLFLSIAVYISSFGLLILLIVGTVWFAWSSFSAQIAGTVPNPNAELSQSVEAKKHVDGLLEKYKKQNSGRINVDVGEDGLTEGQRDNLDEEAEFQRINEFTNDYRKAQLEGAIGKTPETQEKEMQALAYQFVKTAGIFIILFVITFLWGLFYFPAACAVAGYTRSFTATINPLVGLDTIKHLGVDYLKILGFSILISLMSVIVGIILGIIFFPFNLPNFGNIPAQFVGSFATFYFSVVFAVTLGYALYKNSEKLKLYRG